MREAGVIGQFERRLVELGCPAGELRRKVRELADHREDLAQDAREEGLSEAEAAARAGELLGDPVALAEQIAAVLRQSSWWGRHPVIGFCLLPLLAMPVMVGFGVALDYLIGEGYFNADEFKMLAEQRAGLMLFPAAVMATYYAVIALTAIGFVRLAGRSASGWKWALAACGVCVIHGYFAALVITPHRFSFGYGLPAGLFSRAWIPRDWIAPAIPMAIAAAVWARQRWLESRLPSLPLAAEGRREPNLPRTPWLTPSSVIAMMLTMAIAAGFYLVGMVVAKEKARVVELETKIWPAERAAVKEHLKARQSASPGWRVIPINLKSRLNAGLADPLGGADGAKDNNLAGLPAGIHIFAGVPFDVEGRLQLMGRKLADTGRRFPGRVRQIEIGGECSRIHLLHGASFAGAELAGTNLARLVLHYADGGEAQIPIVAGEHVLDCWGPVYRTGADPRTRQTTSPGTELAWVGVNPSIRKTAPELSLRLYRSSFDNPRPGVTVVSLDYVSAMTDAAPFLVGLTVE